MQKPQQSPPTVFIDGEAGTTGLEIAGRLERDARYRVLRIDPQRRKDSTARRDLMAAADVVILCLPDGAAVEAVALAASLGAESPRIIDASTAHRVAPGWVYGFAEMAPGQAEAIRDAARVANPGCYPTGAIALLRPLINAGLIAAGHPITINAVSGYSGGGKPMIEAYEKREAPAYELYGLGLEHKHVAELHIYSGLTVRPIFVPSVGNFRQGMLVSVPLHLDALPGRPTAAELEAAWRKHYAGAKSVGVRGASEDTVRGDRIDALALNGTDRMELQVFANEARRHAVLIARLDNLGKGAAGAAVQNLALMTGV